MPGSPVKGMTETAPPASNVEPIRQAALRRFWARMAAVYGYRWNSAFGDAAEDEQGVLTVAGDTWRRGLAGVTETQIGTGIAACIASTDPWPPTLPAFRAHCLGIPSLAEVARAIAQPAAKHSPFVRQVWQHLNGWAFARCDQVRADRMLKGAYELARDHVMRGGALPEPSLEIEHQQETRTPARAEIVAAEMAKMAAKFGSAPATDEAAAAFEQCYGTAEQVRAECPEASE